jgi:glycosyltransferase involved in cell wall biosynthesis
MPLSYACLVRRAGAPRRAEMHAQPLRVDAVTELPGRIAVGGGGALFVDGRCSHPAGPIRKLVVTLEFGGPAAPDRREQPALGWDMAPPAHLGGPNDYWWSIVTLPPIDAPRCATLGLRASLPDGSEASGQLGTVQLVPKLEPADLGVSSSAREAPREAQRATSNAPFVVVCMATYNPQPELLQRQIESIRRQTHDNWICVVSDGGSSVDAVAALTEAIGDDDRFRLSIYGERLGVYHNFERALLMVPSDADYVALSDQDDYWQPTKLEELLAGLEPGARLTYSNARLIDRTARVIDETLWRAGNIDHASFASLMVTTSGNIPGAAMLFEASLLDDVLPFPPGYPGGYHDFWIARVALALGKVSYVDKPLYDYVQHDEQTLGASAAPAAARGPVAEIRHRIAGIRDRGIRPGWRRSLYFDDYLRVLLAARALEIRCGGRMSMSNRRTLRALADSPRGVAWLAVRSTRPWFGATETRGAERRFLAGLAWRHCAEWSKRLPRGTRRILHRKPC